ncbi:WcbI family polysaccharide biosynthesis putative acetyltransferase [Agilicoccus flavus]|uniref:WcbI family polysaccharide biosynthesis putative acetyltransferase n=1 Tax=Agilicoccus flavus TaxID=2775968 RepID=UPI001CF65D99|nr:WcbI family polysaccharide biosynthesis putative acetyltransferase [Agilicoccus flavus]
MTSTRETPETAPDGSVPAIEDNGLPDPERWEQVATREARPDDRPLLLVHGNCQAESLRVLCQGALGDQVRSVRVPPVFELTAEQVDTFHALVARTSFLVTQPIVDDYRDLPLGTAQIEALLPGSAHVARVPVLRWSALMPTHAIVRAAGVGDPPGVPYHDLRVLAAAARGEREADLSEPSRSAVREVHRITREQLAVRQEHHGTVDALPLFEDAQGEGAWTINHPGNPVLIGVARLALERLGVPAAVTDPGRVLLATTTAPLAASTLDALDYAGTPREDWTHEGRTHSAAEIAATQLAWYGEHPQVVEAGLRRHRDTLDVLGLAV